MEATCISINRWINKETVVCIYNGILTLRRMYLKSVVVRWMNLLYRTCYTTEVNQKKKNKYHILTHIYGLQKEILMNTYLQSSNGDSGIENRLWTPPGKERGDKLTVVLKHITICKLDKGGSGCITQGTQHGTLRQQRGVGWGEE